MTDIDISDDDRLGLLTEDVSREQDWYWNRFSSLSALYAGLLVLVTSDAMKRLLPLDAIVIGLGLVDN